MVKVGIIGGAGYTAGELLRLLLAHPEIEIAFVRSESHVGRPVWDAHPDLFGETPLLFTDKVPLDGDIDVLFLCVGHGRSRAFLEEHEVPEEVKVIDLSADFRPEEDRWHEHREFIYGLPELHRGAIRNASSIANPGCFATLLQLSLLPLAGIGMLKDTVHAHGITGSTGAGAGLVPTSHFTWRTENVSIYKPFTHQHVDEVRRSLRVLQPECDAPIRFIPVRGNFTRGIFATVYTETSLNQREVGELYESFYAEHPFTFVTDSPPDLKRVVNTNKVLLHLQKHDDVLLVTGALDNLLKGAVGQAVQNMNLIFGFDERTGLRLKATGF